jgi:hypothetical protein
MPVGIAGMLIVDGVMRAIACVWTSVWEGIAAALVIPSGISSGSNTFLSFHKAMFRARVLFHVCIHIRKYRLNSSGNGAGGDGRKSKPTVPGFLELVLLQLANYFG